ncbi:aminopeptidase [Pseudobdellovibrio sp. HCB154]|uniref:aminopeptidase n=1 Tax=Pseudobdellovibrio sp. HCB154 TaxID=3386277 RepID=UPI003916EF2F
MKKTTLLAISFLFLTSCQLGYYFKSAKNQFSMMASREPVSEVLNQDSLTEAQKNKLRLSQQAREFAFNDLHLKQTKNYDTYIDLKRPYVTWVVNAAYKWELKNYQWSYPIVGAMPYKGFFSEEEAKEEAEDLKKQGLDTNVRGVSAYSTLGWFKDSVLSSMLRYKDHDLVNTIIHEITHTTVYIKHNADFNERLAVFIGNKGTEMFYKKLEGQDSPTVKTILAEYEDDKLFSSFISEQIKQLEAWYKSNSEQNEKLRQEQFEKIKEAFKAQVSPKIKAGSYSRFLTETMNNATLGLMRTYMEDLSDFEKLYAKCGDNMDQFIEKVKTLEKSDDPAADLKKLAQ